MVRAQAQEALVEVQDLQVVVLIVQFNGTTIPMVATQDKAKIRNLDLIKTHRGIIIYNDLQMLLRTRCSWYARNATRIDSE